jgi:hypothetical protein
MIDTIRIRKEIQMIKMYIIAIEVIIFIVINETLKRKINDYSYEQWISLYIFLITIIITIRW